MKKLRICVIGIGFIGRQHIDAIRRVPGVEIAAISDLNEENLRAYAEAQAIPKYYTDYIEMLDTEKPDIVHVATPNYMHFEMSREAILRGIHVYCEKPLALNASESSELVRLAKEHNVFAAVNFNYRQNAMAKDMRARVHAADGAFGRPTLVHGYYMQEYGLSNQAGGWKLDPEKGGETRALGDIGSHWFDTAQYVLGARVKSVLAEFKILYPERSGIPVVNEDLGMVLVRFEDGTLGNMMASVISAGHRNDLVLTVEGTNYAMKWTQENADQLEILTREGNSVVKAGMGAMTEEARPFAALPSGHPVGWADAFKNGVSAFYTAVRTGKAEGYATFEDGDYVMRILEACLESSRTKKWTDVK